MSQLLTTFKRVCANDECGLEAYYRKQHCYDAAC